jgi:hypothetical protein
MLPDKQGIDFYRPYPKLRARDRANFHSTCMSEQAFILLKAARNHEIHISKRLYMFFTHT